MLTQRYVKLFQRDRRNLIILLAQVPLLALAIVGLYKVDVFAAGTDAGNAVTVLFLVVTMTIWFGSIDGAREIIKEKSVYVREAAVGVRTGAYLLSKAAVLFTLATLQTLVLAAVVFFFHRLHEGPGTYATIVGLLDPDVLRVGGDGPAHVGGGAHAGPGDELHPARARPAAVLRRLDRGDRDDEHAAAGAVQRGRGEVGLRRAGLGDRPQRAHRGQPGVREGQHVRRRLLRDHDRPRGARARRSSWSSRSSAIFFLLRRDHA